MDEIKFIKEPEKYNTVGCLAIKLSGHKSKYELFSALHKKLNFPIYFGHNWDALLDCFCDLKWIHEKKIIIIHENSFSMSRENMKIYLEILKEAINTWKNKTEHELEIIFPTELQRYEEIR